MGIATHSANNVRIEDCGAEAEQSLEEELTDMAEGGSVDSALTNLAPNPPSACNDSKYRLQEWYWSSTYVWKFNRDSTPDYLNKEDVRDAIQQATSAITDTHTNCSSFGDGSVPSDVVPVGHMYDSATSLKASIQETGCKSPDGVSVTDFGNLPPEKYGRTCTWFNTNTGAATESDMRLNKTDNYQWVPWTTPGCINAYSVRAGATHERGHTFGLKHVAEKFHGNLTMSPLIGDEQKPDGLCAEGQYTLGWGDVLGLAARY